MGPHITTEILRAVVLGMILTIFFGAIASWIWVIGRLLRGESLLPETPLVERREPPWGLGTILLILVTYIFGMYAASAWYAPARRAEHPREAVAAPVPADQTEAKGPGPAEADRRPEEGPPREPDRIAAREPDARTPRPPEDKEADSSPPDSRRSSSCPSRARSTASSSCSSRSSPG